MRRRSDNRKLLLPLLTLAVLLAALGLLLKHPSVAPGQGADGLIELAGPTMGTHYRVLVPQNVATSRQLEDLGTLVGNRLAYLDTGLFSTYTDHSQLSGINHLEPGRPMPLADEMVRVLAAANRIAARSGGAFDITVKPLVDLWGFGPGFTAGEVPDTARIAAALAETGMDRFMVDSATGTVLKLAPVTLDLSAIAKGFAVDDIADLLRGKGITNFLVEIGGEVHLSGTRPDGNSWQLGIEVPVPGESRLFQALSVAHDAPGIATSGNYRNYFDHAGVRYSHTLDPHTGWPVTHDLVSVTVIAGSAIEADAWATAMAVLGTEAGMKLANELQLAVYFIVDGASGFRALHSIAFNRFL
jgi:thiamine biosynthesis lipoprotein